VNRFVQGVSALAVLAALAASNAQASAGPVGALPKGPVTAISVKKGELVAVALPSAAASTGLVWRVARAYNGKVVSEVTEGDLKADVVIVYKAVGVGKTSIVYALTKGESATAQQAKTFVVTVSR
jgi:hypothetical protein